MTEYEKPIYVSCGTFEYSGMLVAPLKPGTKIRLLKDSGFYRHEQRFLVGFLEYRDWLKSPDPNAAYRLDAGVRYGALESDWQVILSGDTWEVV